MIVVSLFFVGIALLDAWLASAWQSLGWIGQWMLCVAMLCLVLCDACAAWINGRREPAQSADDVERDAILSNAVNEALLWSAEYWQAWPQRKEDEV